MIIRKALFAIASAGLLFSGTVAAQAGDIRAASPVENAENAANTGLILLLALVVAGGATLALTGDDDAPTSP